MFLTLPFAGGKPTKNARSGRRVRRPRPERTALLLSGGGNLSVFHLGVVEVLLENKLLPNVLAGASAGSLTAAMIGTRSERALQALLREKRGLLSLADKQLTGPVTSESYRAFLATVIPDVTFAQAEKISGRAINISVSPQHGGGGLVCGPKTTPNVLVRDAVLASCAVPGVFEPVMLRQRVDRKILPFRGRRKWIDGSVDADVPAGFIKRRYGIRYTIVSMVNPIARPFLSDRERADQRLATRSVVYALRTSTVGWLGMGRACAGSMPRLRETLDLAHRVLRQDYRGDLMLTPSKRFFPLAEIMNQPTKTTMRRLATDGKVRTRARLDELREFARAV
jgi:TAG lipase / steryl ester hydrolase / phospholipase A2 / LPA acyltransferase